MIPDSRGRKKLLHESRSLVVATAGNWVIGTKSVQDPPENQLQLGNSVRFHLRPNHLLHRRLAFFLCRKILALQPPHLL